MLIERLRLTGFKSFVEPTELLIGPGLTGVVGPNGCGKSNLLEAIRWTMGESSPRSMRGAGMDDVIFAGTATRPRRDFAEVTLVCDSQGASLPALVHAGAMRDGDSGPHASTTVEIVRRIERGAGSAYRANGHDVRARDVALLFADAAIGAHSPALVSQGKVAGIIAARPQERRQLLEEAAGVAGLHARRKDAEQKLRATETNLARLADLLSDMDTRAASLRRQARAAERYINLTEQIRTAEARMLFARWRSAAGQADVARTAAAAAEQAVGVAQAAQAGSSAAQAETAALLAAARTAAARAREAELALSAAHQAAVSERDALVRRQRELTAELSRIASDHAAEDALARDGAAAIARLNAAAQAAARAMAARERARPDLARLGAHAADALRDAEVALAQARGDQANEQAERRIAAAALGEATRRLDRLTSDIARIDAELAGAGDEAALTRMVASAGAAVAAGEAASGVAERAVAAGTAAVESAGGAQALASEALSVARANLSALDSERAALTRSLALGLLAAGGGAAGASLLSQLRAEPGYEETVGAALGDDLGAPLNDPHDAGARGWTGAAAQAGDPPLPPGTRSLADVVSAPPALARRLAQIAVADTDSGQVLHVGQRLVTPGGRMRRWDGFVASGDGAAAADRLVRTNRAAALDTARDHLAAAFDDAEAALAHCVAERAAAQGAHDVARRDLLLTEQALREARRALGSAEGALDRCRSARAHLAGRHDEVRDDHAAAVAARDVAQAALTLLPDGADSEARRSAHEDAADRARAQANDVGAALIALESAIAAQREAQIEASAESRGWAARAGEGARRIAAMAARTTELEREVATIADRPATLTAQMADLAGQLAATRAGLCELVGAEAAAQGLARQHEATLEVAREALSAAREARAAAVARAEAAEARRIDAGRITGERFGCPPPLLPTQAGFAEAEVSDADAEAVRHDRLYAERERIGPVNLVAAQELAEIEGTHAASAAEAAELQLAVNRLRGSIGHLNREGRERLLAAFEQVDGHFRRLFATLFDGGQAHLALTESDDPLEAGLEIMAQPPGKKLSALTLLSGGEQALTAIALIFALFLTNPAPICVLDEVDAPLDDANVERFCDLLDAMSRDTATRYLIVTHNAVTMARMHRLFGVTMVERGVSRLVSVDLGGAEELLAAE